MKYVDAVVNCTIWHFTVRLTEALTAAAVEAAIVRVEKALGWVVNFCRSTWCIVIFQILCQRHPALPAWQCAEAYRKLTFKHADL